MSSAAGTPVACGFAAEVGFAAGDAGLTTVAGDVTGADLVGEAPLVPAGAGPGVRGVFVAIGVAGAADGAFAVGAALGEDCDGAFVAGTPV